MCNPTCSNKYNLRSSMDCLLLNDKECNGVLWMYTANVIVMTTDINRTPVSKTRLLSPYQLTHDKGIAIYT